MNELKGSVLNCSRLLIFLANGFVLYHFFDMALHGVFEEVWAHRQTRPSCLTIGAVSDNSICIPPFQRPSLGQQGTWHVVCIKQQHYTPLSQKVNTFTLAL